MAERPVYLAKYRMSTNQRAHFAIFIPNDVPRDEDISQTFRSASCKGTTIQVLGEPLMSGFELQFERNYDCSTPTDLQELVLLGHVDVGHLYLPLDEVLVKEATPRAKLEFEATRIAPPPKGQNIRLPIDGINTRRCQEWTTEYLRSLAGRGLISASAVDIAQSQRDPPSHGIFGQH